MPGHGSLKTELTGCSSQLASSLHFIRTMTREFLALQFVLLTLVWLQVFESSKELRKMLFCLVTSVRRRKNSESPCNFVSLVPASVQPITYTSPILRFMSNAAKFTSIGLTFFIVKTLFGTLASD